MEIDYEKLAEEIVKRLPKTPAYYPVWVDPRYYNPVPQPGWWRWMSSDSRDVNWSLEVE